MQPNGWRKYPGLEWVAINLSLVCIAGACYFTEGRGSISYFFWGWLRDGGGLRELLYKFYNYKWAKLLEIWVTRYFSESFIYSVFCKAWYFCPLVLRVCINWTESDCGPAMLKIWREETAKTLSLWKLCICSIASVVFHGTSWHFHVVGCFLFLARNLGSCTTEQDCYCGRQAQSCFLLGLVGHLQDFFFLSASCLLSFPSECSNVA